MALGLAVALPFSSGVVTPPVTYAEWNQADAATSIVVEPDGVTVSTSGGSTSWRSLRADQSVSAGKWYWEILPLNSSGYMIVGVANGSASLATFAGATADAWAYYGLNGNQAHGGLVAYGATYADGDVIGVALDAGAMTLEFFKNNASQGSIDISSMTGPLFPIASTYFGTQANYFTSNFGATALTYSPPSGYNAGLYV